MTTEDYKGWKIHSEYEPGMDEGDLDWWVEGPQGQLVDVEDRADAVDLIDEIEGERHAANRGPFAYLG